MCPAWSQTWTGKICISFIVAHRCSAIHNSLLPSTFHHYSVLTKTHKTPFPSSSFSRSIKASRGSIMTPLFRDWGSLMAKADSVWATSTRVNQKSFDLHQTHPAAPCASDLVTKEQTTHWFFAQRLIDLIRPRYQQKRDIITFVQEHSGTFQRGTVEGKLSRWESVCVLV